VYAWTAMLLVACLAMHQVWLMAAALTLTVWWRPSRVRVWACNPKTGITREEVYPAVS